MGVRRRYRLSLPRRHALVGGTARGHVRWRAGVAVAAAFAVIVAATVLGPKRAHVANGGYVADGGGKPIAISTERVALYPQAPERRALGKLVYRGGLVLRSADPRFGGISGLLLAPDCTTFRAVSDHGWWVSGRLLYDADGDLAGIAHTGIAPLVSEQGRRLRNSGSRDAESLASMPDGGTAVSFEGRLNALRVYYPGKQPPLRLESPIQKADAIGNEGVEALTALADGSLLAISEDIMVGEGVKAWIGGDGAPWRPTVYRVDGGFRPTGAATLPDGDVMVLERRMLPPAARLRHLRRDDIGRHAVLLGDGVARFDGPLTYDNMEGVDACTAENGEIRLLLASDDNYNWFQRTLFLMFALPR